MYPLRYFSVKFIGIKGICIVAPLSSRFISRTLFLIAVPFLKIYLFLAALGLCWGAQALRCCTRAFSSCGVLASHCDGFSYCEAQALGPTGSVATARRLWSTGSAVVVHWLSWPAAFGILVPGPGIEPVFPTLAGRFLATWPPGKSPKLHLIKLKLCPH